MDAYTTIIVSIGSSAIATGVSYLLPALGENVSQRSGVLNIGLEGYMLTGALTAYYAYVATGSPWYGFLMAAVAGMMLSLLHSLFVVTMKCDQIVSGVGIWLLALGLNTYIFRLVGEDTLVPMMPVLPVPLLSSLPVIGPILFRQNVVVYINLLLVPIFWIVLNRTSWGLLNRAAGDSPLATDMAGHNVSLIRYVSTGISGMMAGLGGAYLAVGVLSRFTEGIIAGRGFIAIAIVIFGNWDPVRIVAGALAFGVVDALQLYLQATGSIVPYPILILTPYLVTLVVLAMISRTARNMPRKLAVPYYRGQE